MSHIQQNIQSFEELWKDNFAEVSVWHYIGWIEGTVLESGCYFSQHYTGSFLVSQALLSELFYALFFFPQVLKPIPFNSTSSWIISYPNTSVLFSWMHFPEPWKTNLTVTLESKPVYCFSCFGHFCLSENMLLWKLKPFYNYLTQKGRSAERTGLLEIHRSPSVREKFNNLAENHQNELQELSEAEGLCLKMKTSLHMLCSLPAAIKHQVPLPAHPEL